MKIINNRQELKNYLISVFEKTGSKAICKICNTQGRDVAFNNPRLVSESCCVEIDCEFRKTGVDCKENIKMTCLFHSCRFLMFHNVELTNYINRIKESVTYPYKSVDDGPVEIEEFIRKAQDNEV